MESYTEDVHLESKGFVTDISTNDLSSLERDTEERQPGFEPLEVQLRFELGSLVDTHVLIDTDGQRESHWDFVRQEQGRFRASSEENNVLLSHDKQDESFNNCENWPRSASQEDRRMFIDAQDDVRMFTEALAGKDKSVVDVVEDDRGLLLPSINQQRKEETAWIGEDQQALEEKPSLSSQGDDIERTVDVSQNSIHKSDARSSDNGETQQTPMDAYEENHQDQCPVANVSEELHLSAQQMRVAEADAAHLTVSKSSSKGGNEDEKGLFKSSKRCILETSRDHVETSQSELSNVDLEEPENTERVDLTEEIEVQTDNVRLPWASEGNPKMDIVDSKTGLKTGTETKTAEKMYSNLDLAGTVGNNNIAQRTKLADECQKLCSEVVCQPLGLVAESRMVTDMNKASVLPERSRLDSMPAGSSLGIETADTAEKQNASKVETRGVPSKLQETQAIGMDNVPVPERSEEITVLGTVDVPSTYENAGGKSVTSHEETSALEGKIDLARETLDLKRQIDSALTASKPSHNFLSAVTLTAPVASEVNKAGPAAHASERTYSYESGAERLANNNSITRLEKAEVMHGTSTASKLSVAKACPTHIEITGGQLLASKGLHVSDGDGEVGAADNSVSYQHAIDSVLDPQHSSKSLEKQVGAQEIQDDFTDGTVANKREKSLLHERNIEQHRTDNSAKNHPFYSATVCQSNESKVITDTSHPGGILHVFLDVQKDRIRDDCLPKNALDQGHLTMAQAEVLADTQAFNPNVTTAQEYGIGATNAAVGCSDSYIFGSVAQVSQEDLSPTHENSGKRKADQSVRNSRLKDSARASPSRVRLDEEERNSGAECSGRHKAAFKSVSQKKGMDLIESCISPKKPGSKGSSGRKKISSPIVQDAGKETCQTVANTGKIVFPLSLRHQVPPDVNGSENSVPKPSQTFSEPQQVQLRAQILVYGSLIQGAAPEEALMVAAFSNVGGGPIGRDGALSERAVWEKLWQTAMNRIHSKVPRDSFTTCANSALVSNSPVATAKAAESSLKTNVSAGIANSAIDYNRPASLLARPLDVSGMKGQVSRARLSSDPAQDVPVSGRQAIVTATPLASATVAASRPASLTLCESFSQPPKPRTDFQQVAPQNYFPGSPLGHLMTGPPQWFSATTFPGSWMPQNQTTAYANPSLFTHAQAAASSDQTSEMRRSTPSSSGTTMLSNTFSTTLFTPIIGSMSLTANPIADPLLAKQNTSESRPRKRKKMQFESYGPSTDASPSHATGSSPVVGALVTSTQSQMETGQACPGVTSSVHTPLPAITEALAVVVASTQLAKSSQETSLVAMPANKVLVACPASMPNAGLPSVKIFCDSPIDLQSSANCLSQAQASAEEAASAAASALRESELVWSQLKAQKNLGSIPNFESQLVSSAVAVATAASVAKAAAAAAKAAYEAAAQAKKISEGVLEVGNQVSESSRLLGYKDETISEAGGMPESFNSILTAAKMASKQRLEAVSAARTRAENFESVVRAAELAANAITQVGSVMAMGENVPFTLDMLLEAGPEGLLRSEEKMKTKTKSTASKLPCTTGTPKSVDLEKRFSFKIGSSNEAVGQRDAQMDSWTSDNIMAACPENDMRINTELGVGLAAELNKQKATDHLGLSTPTPKQGLLTHRTESELMEQGVLAAGNKFGKGSLVEVMSDENDLQGVWFSARVQSLDEGKVFVLYDDLLADDGYSPLEEWIQLKGSSGKAPRVRLAHPNTHIGFEGTRKRRREAMGSHNWSVGDHVDAWIRDGWWEGEIKEIIEDGDSKAKIFFPGDGDTSIVKMSKLRPSLLWSNGQWVLWNDAKKESSKARIDVHEFQGETPFAKRQKIEKVQASSMKQKLMPGSSADISVIHTDQSLFDCSTVKVATDFKRLAADSVAIPRLQTSKVAFGVPRPTKKRKLIEVSKHFGTARGVSGASTFGLKASTNKAENILVFASGPSDTSRIDVSKAKKRVLHQPKARPQKDTAADVKVSGAKEKAGLSSKTILRRNLLNKDGLPMLPRNKEGNPMKKTNILSENNQLEPRERSEGRALSSKVETQTPSISHADIDKESSLAPRGDGKPNDVGHESRKEPSQAAHLTDGNQASGNRASNNKQKIKQSALQGKDGCIKSSTPASGKDIAAQSSKRREPLPPKDNEETVQKETESQPNREDEKVEPSGKRHSANLVNNGEKQQVLSTKESAKNKELEKPVPEAWEPRRTSRKIQPTSKLLEGLQTAPKLGKNNSSHDRAYRGTPKPTPQA